MGITNHKKTIKCECGCDYGSCGRHNVFIMKYNRSVDIGTILIKRHVEELDSKFECLGSFTDNDLRALLDVISGKTLEILNDDEKKDIDKIW